MKPPFRVRVSLLYCPGGFKVLSSEDVSISASWGAGTVHLSWRPGLFICLFVNNGTRIKPGLRHAKQLLCHWSTFPDYIALNAKPHFQSLQVSHSLHQVSQYHPPLPTFSAIMAYFISDILFMHMFGGFAHSSLAQNVLLLEPALSLRGLFYWVWCGWIHLFHLWEPEVDSKCLPLLLTTLYFETGFPTKPGTCWLG